MILHPEQTVLAVIDVQERLMPHIQGGDHIVARCLRLIEGFRALNLPVVITEQYPKGLGRTVAAILERASGFPVIEKRDFSSCGAPEFLRALAGRDQVLLCGVEAHVCVSQTALDLLAEGRQVHVAGDAAGSRTLEDREVGLQKMRAAGAVPASSESALFELLRTSTHAQFKAISALVR
ncbi:MAG: hydrolase [Candidatus Sumerlaeia bacterium]|nr:hydrolase [Candidatus Sumerlaeia bacterium]